MQSQPPAHVPVLQLVQRIWPLVLVVVVLVVMASGSLYLVSAVRAFVAGESLWSKAQKDAIYALSRYVDSGSARDLARFEQAMADRKSTRLNSSHLVISYAVFC